MTKVAHKAKSNTRVTSAKQPSQPPMHPDLRIRSKPSKEAIKEKIFNYENYIGGIDMPPLSAAMSPT